MNTRSARVVATMAIFGLIVVGSLSGCTTAQADSLDLTYFYLPG